MTLTHNEKTLMKIVGSHPVRWMRTHDGRLAVPGFAGHEGWLILGKTWKESLAAARRVRDARK